MKDRVFMITQLDSENGYAIGRRVFLLMNQAGFHKSFAKICGDKNVKGTLTTTREVLYEVL